MIMLPKATGVMTDRQPIALIVHDEVGTGGRMENLPGLPPNQIMEALSYHGPMKVVQTLPI